MRINRLRRAIRQTAGVLTHAQWEILAYGQIILDQLDADFASEQEAQRAWFVHRTRMMQQFHAEKPGRRPHAFFKFELHCEPKSWKDEIRILLDHKLIDTREALAIERVDPVFGPQRTEDGLYQGFDILGILEQDVKCGLGTAYRELFVLAERWHRWRGRTEVAEKYGTYAEMVRRALSTREA